MGRMKPVLLTPILGLVLSGCAASMLASAAGMALRAGQPQPQSNKHLRPIAEATCSKHAAQFGTVRVIDVVQPAIDRIVVWGTTGEGTQRRSFECGFKTKISYFKLRDIVARR